MTCFRPAIIFAAACLSFLACRPHAKTKLIVLGVDGMDPGFVERHWEALPNLAKLRREGHFQRLGTSRPPQSPVAWSSFITGLEPAEHGLFDFVHRDPKTLQPFSSMSRTEAPGWVLPLGVYRFPLLPSKVVSLRQGRPFWQSLADQGIPVTIMRMPTNYPPVPVGKAISGMGTPDLLGTLGTFTFFTDEADELSRSVAGGRIVKVHLDRGHVALPLQGPPNTLRKDQPDTSVVVIADVDPEAAAVRLTVHGDAVILREGEWSDWMAVSFPLLPHLSSVAGTFRVFAKKLHSGFQLYVSPINIDPVAPALPIATPDGWGREIARKTGRFATLGIPEDTSALRQDVISLAEFQSQMRLVAAEERRLLRYTLRHFTDGGLLFFYFSSVDQNSHILWARHEPELLAVYREVDDAIGEVRRTSPSVQLIVLSDHGFSTFQRAVHLNSWLRDRGFLNLKGPAGDGSDLGSIDWSSTEAYAVGLNGLYLNLRHREAHGIVAAGEERDALLQNLTEQLLAWRDPVDDHQIVKSVYREHPSQANAAIAPDLIVGYAAGYRASWQTALGATPTSELADNTDAWIGDHCIDPDEVPGVLFTSYRMDERKMGLTDVSSLIFNAFKEGS